MSKVFVVLPAYNESQNLPGVLGRIRTVLGDAGLSYQVVLIDDGSTDDTLAIARHHAARMPIAIQQHPVNQGLGAALRDGFDAAMRLAAPDDAIVTLDADETHDPALIPKMVFLVERGCGAVIASRYRPGSRVEGVPLFRRVLSRGASWFFRVLFPTPGVRDYTCGYRAYRAGVLSAALSEYRGRLVGDDGFGCMAEVLLKLRRMRVSFQEVPMTLRYDLKRGTSKMKIVRTIGRTLALAVRNKGRA